MFFGPAERASYLRWRDQFEAVMDPRLYSIEWLDRQMLNGVYRIWPGEGAAIIAGLKHYPTGAVDIEGIVAAGDAEEIVSCLIPQAEEWGRSIGCIGALISSREGWGRLLKKHGYGPHQFSIRKVF